MWVAKNEGRTLRAEVHFNARHERRTRSMYRAISNILLTTREWLHTFSAPNENI